MPLQYYDPMLYASTSANPNVMSVTVTLTEPVEGELLREAVEQCRVRFPYFYIRPRVEGNELIPVPNPLPVIVVLILLSSLTMLESASHRAVVRMGSAVPTA